MEVSHIGVAPRDPTFFPLLNVGASKKYGVNSEEFLTFVVATFHPMIPQPFAWSNPSYVPANVIKKCNAYKV